jgi:hypothetical protein
MLRTFALSVIVLLLAGCNQDQIASLEKQNQGLKSELEKNRVATEYDLQAKCSKDAKAWFDDNWGMTSREKKETKLLDFTNHYNKSMNKCFIEVERHYLIDNKTESWTGEITLWDVYENSEYGRFGANHYIRFENTVLTSDEVVLCELLDKTCKTVDEFNSLAQPYMAN